MNNIITKGIIKDCFDQLSKEENITIAAWNESDFVLQYHKRTISPIDSQSECSKNIAEEYKFYTNNGHFAKDQLNMVYVHPKGEGLSVDGVDSAIGVNQGDNSHCTCFLEPKSYNYHPLLIILEKDRNVSLQLFPPPSRIIISKK